MAEFDRHLEQAKHNQNLLNHFSQNNFSKEFSDWYTTVSFYSALHYVEALICKSGSLLISQHPRVIVKEKHSSHFKSVLNTDSEHYVRYVLLTNNPRTLGNIANPYGNLYEASRTARYDCHSYNSNSYIESEEDLTVIKKEFNKLTSKK